MPPENGRTPRLHVGVAPSAALSARERFSEASAAVWTSATDESRRLNHYYLGVEHLMLGLVARAQLLLDRTLSPSQVTAEMVDARLREEISPGPDPDWERIRVTPRLRTVLVLADALREAASYPYLEPIHLLSAILQEGQSIPARVLRSLGVCPEEVGTRLLRSASRAPGGCTSTPVLDRIGRDLVALASGGVFDPLVGRERELGLLLEVLCRRSKNNPVLLGEAGVGKTAIVEGLAQRIADGRVPPPLRRARIVQVSAGRLLAGTGTQAENQVREILDELRRTPDLILFVDEMHALAGGPGADAAALLKPPLARGEFRCIGATTLAEYRRFVEGEPALERRFQSIMVDEPGKALTLEILRGLRDRYERHHRVTLSDPALLACVTLSGQYLRDRQQPDKAIDLMDQAAARVAIRASGSDVRRPVSPAVVTEGDDGICALPTVVSMADVAGVVSDLLGMEVPISGSYDPSRLRDLERFLSDRVLGQEDAIAAVAQVIRVAKRELDLRPFRPDGVILLSGPGGVGKTLLAHAVCDFLHGEDPDSLVRLDMSDYSEPHTLARLIGPPPGYIGYEEEGQLTGRVRTRPDCVLLLDDIDRAHPSVRALFLQVFDEGRLTDSRGRCIHFDHTTIILTTSAALTAEVGSVGFRKGGNEQDVARLMSVLNDSLTAEFVSRVDRVVPLKSLSSETIVQIAERMLLQVSARLSAEGKELVIEPGVAELVAAYRHVPRHGARHLARAVEDLVIEPLSTLSYREEWNRANGCRLTAEGAAVRLELIPCSG